MCLVVALLMLAFVIGEVASIAMLGSYLGFWTTMAILAAGGLLGVLLLRGQAVRTLQKAGERYRRGDPIADTFARSALTAGAGFLFFSPGVLSDLIAVLLLVPPVRPILAGRMVRAVRARAVELGHAPPGAGPIDAEAVEKPPEPPPALP